MRLLPPEPTGPPCGCDRCRTARCTKPPVRTPEGTLHGDALVRWYAERAKAVAALERVRTRRIPGGWRDGR